MDNNLNEPYSIVADLSGVPVAATLIRRENTLAYFTVDGYLELNDTVLACPYDEIEYAGLPSIDAMRNHPRRLTGKVTRVDENEVYLVRITMQATDRESYRLQSGSSSMVVNEEGLYCVVISLMGLPDLQKFVRFHDAIREQATRRLNLVIDLSGVEKLPRTASAIFTDLIASLTKKKRRIALIHGNILGEAFMESVGKNSYVHHFRNPDDAQRYFQRYPICVLVVEDEAVTMEVLKAFLKERKLLPLTAASGEEALQIVQSQKPDLILMDIHLPGMSGLETVQQIREQKAFSDIPVIILSAESDQAIVRSSVQLNVNGYVLKPFKPDSLSRKILAALTD